MLISGCLSIPELSQKHNNILILGWNYVDFKYLSICGFGWKLNNMLILCWKNQYHANDQSPFKWRFYVKKINIVDLYSVPGAPDVTLK